MGRQISYNENPLGSIVLEVMMLMNKKVKTDSIKNLIRLKCIETLKEILYEPQQLIYLDFTVNFDSFGDKCEIISNNIVTALWFCGIFPVYVEDIIVENKFYFEYGYYKYYDKIKKLKLFK